ncbi:MAG: hypothetical protein GC158_12765 [Cyanobacteria bacterium RI_101]|nr:hypothetical protein [Cyanobacteria bacterium RI_101]
MTATIETDLKEVLGDFKQEFSKLNQHLDIIQKDLTDLKVSQADIRGDIRTLDEKVNGLGKRLENQEFVNRSILVAIVAAILAGAVKFFGLLPNP